MGFTIQYNVMSLLATVTWSRQGPVLGLEIGKRVFLCLAEAMVNLGNCFLPSLLLPVLETKSERDRVLRESWFLGLGFPKCCHVAVLGYPGTHQNL